MASKETEIKEQEVVTMRSRSRHPMDAENIETLLTKLENNPDNVTPHEQYQSHQHDQATELVMMNTARSKRTANGKGGRNDEG